MDPYYQQNALQRDPTVSQQQSVAQQMQQAGQGQGHHQSSSHHHRSAAAANYAQQQAQLAQQGQPQQAYMDGTMLDPQQQQQQQAAMQAAQQPVPVAGGHHHPSSSSHHHHGPSHHHSSSAAAGGHHSSPRYQSGSHRNAVMHQHRSSAAAISDPMMASTMTDHLASASGPLTGSGSALNQLGVSSAYPTQPGYGGAGQVPYAQQPLYRGDPYGPAATHSSSRYDSSHYPSSSRRSRHNAYHLDRADLGTDQMLVGGGGSRDHRSTSVGYYPNASSGAPLHHSIGNLPSATSRLDGRYAPDGGFVGQPQRAPDMRYYDGGALAPPPPGSLEAAGLGAYNPLDDPVASLQQQHQLAVGGMPQAQFSTLNANYGGTATGRDAVIAELKARLQEAQNNYVTVKRELDSTTQKLGSSMHSIKTFWSPELKKERAMRKEEATKYALINDQMKIIRIENQKQAILIRQLEEELRLAHELRMRSADTDIQQHIDALCHEKEALFKENCMLRDTIRELEMRIETQKQTLAARDDSIKKMVEMMNNKGIATKIMEDERLEMDRVKSRNIELETRLRHFESIIEAKEKDIIKPTQSARHRQQASSSGVSSSSSNSPSPQSTSSARNTSQTASKSTTPLAKSERLKKRLAAKQPLPSKERLDEVMTTTVTPTSVKNNSSLVSSRSSSVSADNQRNYSPPAIAPRTSAPSRHQKDISESRTSDRSHENLPLSNAKSQQIYVNTLQVAKREQQDLIYVHQLVGAKSAPGFMPAMLDEPSLCFDDDYLRPIDCSTPKSSRKASECSYASKTLRVEIHSQPPPPRAVAGSATIAINGQYTCLCSPDFNCAHNNTSGEQHQNHYSSSASSLSLLKRQQALDTAHLNANCVAPGCDFMMSDNCVECRNLSLYVNLSRQLSIDNDMGSKNGTTSNNNNNDDGYLTDPYAGNCGAAAEFSTCSGNGLGAGQYKRLLANKDRDLYGTGANALYSSNGIYQQPRERKQQSQSTIVETNFDFTPGGSDSSGYSQLRVVSAPLRAEINSSSTLSCSCNQAQSASFYTAQSQQDDELCVLPAPPRATDVEATVANQSSGGGGGGGGNIDSSLSSLFVYRHPNEANPSTPLAATVTTVPPANFDLDSLELKPADTKSCRSAINKMTASNGASKSALKSARGAPRSKLNALTNGGNTNNNNSSTSSGGSSWLEARPSSDYIKLSTTTTTATTSAGQRLPSGQQQYVSGLEKRGVRFSSATLTSTRSDTNKITASVSLLSSLPLASSLRAACGKSTGCSKQPATNSSSSGLLASCRSASSPSIAALQESSTSTSKQRNNVKSIYNCVKSHFRDMTKSSPPKSSGSTLPRNAQSSTLATRRLNGQQLKVPLKSPLKTPPKTNTMITPTKTHLQQQAVATMPKRVAVSKQTPSPAKMEELRNELSKREQELLTMGAKMKAYEDQQHNSERHIRLLKQSLVDKEEHYNLLLADVEELRRNLDERNRLIEKRSLQQTIGLMSGGAGGRQTASADEMHELLEMRDKKTKELQCKMANLNELLSQKDMQIERLRMRLENTYGGVIGPSSGKGADLNFLAHLEESLGDKEKQISLLRDQKDRYEHELHEERDSHERSVAEYNMKLSSLKFEMDKLQTRLGRARDDKDKFESWQEFERFGSGPGDQPPLVKKLELDKRSLQLEVERLRDRLERLQRIEASGVGGGSRYCSERATSALGGDYSVAEFERLQEALEAQRQELRRAQAECRMSDMERKRAQEELDKLSERFERCQSEMHKLRARMENAINERDQLADECERQQSLISKSQIERDSALSDSNKLKSDNERLQASINKNQLQLEKVQAQLEKAQFEVNKLESRFGDSNDEMRSLQTQRDRLQRELKSLEMNLQASQLQCQRLQQEKEMHKLDLDKIREKYERLEADADRVAHDKEMHSKQVLVYKERVEALQAQLGKHAKDRDAMQAEIAEVREKLQRVQKQSDNNEQETRNEVRVWKDKYERLMAEFERLNEEILAKEKECQMVIDKLQRLQNEVVKLEAKLEQSETDRERLAIELEKSQQVSCKAREDFAKRHDELQQLQEMYTKTNTKLLKLSDVEEKLRIDYDKCQMDLEVLRERYDRLQVESRKLQAERDRLQVELERFRFESRAGPGSAGHLQGGMAAGSGSQSAAHVGGSATEDFARVQAELERALVKLEQYQREMNKLQLEKERLALDSKSIVQQHEQQLQKALLKSKSNEEKLAMELECARAQFDKITARYEQSAVDQEKLVADKERLQQQLLLLQQEVDKFRSQQTNSAEETKRLHNDEMQRAFQELETIRDKYTQQRKELLSLRETQQNHELDKDILRRELESAEQRLNKLAQVDGKQKEGAERAAIELEKMRDKIERKQQELARAQKERAQLAQDAQTLHAQLQQAQAGIDQLQQQIQLQAQQLQSTQQQADSGQQQHPHQQQRGDADIAKLKQMLLKSENELQKTMAENQRLQMEGERLKLQLDDAAEYIGKIEDDKKLAQQQREELTQQLRQVQQQQHQQTQKQDQDEDKQVQAEMKRLQDVITKSAQDAQKLLAERNKLADANQELKANFENASEHFQRTMEQYEGELQRIQQQQQQQKQQQKQEPAAKSQQAASQETEFKAKFEKAVEAIRAFQKTSDDMKREIIKLNDKNKALGAENQSLADSLRAAQEALSRVEIGKQQQQQQQQQPQDVMKQQLNELVQTCELLKKDLAKQSSETNKYQQENQKMRQILDKSSEERDRLKAQLEKLLVELEKRETELVKLQQQQDKSGQSMQQKQNELNNFQKQVEERAKALDAKREEYEALSKQLQQQQQPGDAGQQQEALVKLEKQIKALEEENSKLKAELEKLKAELKKLQGELERLLDILSASEEEKFNLSRQIEQLQSKLKSLSSSSQQQQHHAQQQQQQQQPQQQQQQQPQTQQRPQQQQQTSQQQQHQPQQPQQQQRTQPKGGQSGGAAGFISGLFQ